MRLLEYPSHGSQEGYLSDGDNEEEEMSDSEDEGPRPPPRKVGAPFLLTVSLSNLTILHPRWLNKSQLCCLSYFVFFIVFYYS